MQGLVADEVPIGDISKDSPEIVSGVAALGDWLYMAVGRQIRRMHGKTRHDELVIGLENNEKGSTTPNGQAGKQSKLQRPMGLSVRESPPALFICDVEDHVIRQYDVENDVVRTICGTGDKVTAGEDICGTEAGVASPHSCCYVDGRLFFTSLDTHAVRVLDFRTRKVSTFVGNLRKRDSCAKELFYPTGLCADGRYLYIAVLGDHGVIRVEHGACSDRHVYPLVGTGGAGGGHSRNSSSGAGGVGGTDRLEKSVRAYMGISTAAVGEKMWVEEGGDREMEDGCHCVDLHLDGPLDVCMAAGTLIISTMIGRQVWGVDLKTFLCSRFSTTTPVLPGSSLLSVDCSSRNGKSEARGTSEPRRAQSSTMRSAKKSGFVCFFESYNRVVVNDYENTKLLEFSIPRDAPPVQPKDEHRESMNESMLMRTTTAPCPPYGENHDDDLRGRGGKNHDSPFTIDDSVSPRPHTNQGGRRSSRTHGLIRSRSASNEAIMGTIPHDIHRHSTMGAQEDGAASASSCRSDGGDMLVSGDRDDKGCQVARDQKRTGYNSSRGRSGDVHEKETKRRIASSSAISRRRDRGERSEQRTKPRSHTVGNDEDDEEDDDSRKKKKSKLTPCSARGRAERSGDKNHAPYNDKNGAPSSGRGSRRDASERKDNENNKSGAPSSGRGSRVKSRRRENDDSCRSCSERSIDTHSEKRLKGSSIESLKGGRRSKKDFGGYEVGQRGSVNGDDYGRKKKTLGNRNGECKGLERPRSRQKTRSTSSDRSARRAAVGEKESESDRGRKGRKGKKKEGRGEGGKTSAASSRCSERKNFSLYVKKNEKKKKNSFFDDNTNFLEDEPSLEEEMEEKARKKRQGFKSLRLESLPHETEKEMLLEQRPRKTPHRLVDRSRQNCSSITDAFGTTTRTPRSGRSQHESTPTTTKERRRNEQESEEDRCLFSPLSFVAGGKGMERRHSERTCSSLGRTLSHDLHKSGRHHVGSTDRRTTRGSRARSSSARSRGYQDMPVTKCDMSGGPQPLLSTRSTKSTKSRLTFDESTKDFGSSHGIAWRSGVSSSGTPASYLNAITRGDPPNPSRCGTPTMNTDGYRSASRESSVHLIVHELRQVLEQGMKLLDKSMAGLDRPVSSPKFEFPDIPAPDTSALEEKYLSGFYKVRLMSEDTQSLPTHGPFVEEDGYVQAALKRLPCVQGENDARSKLIDAEEERGYIEKIKYLVVGGGGGSSGSGSTTKSPRRMMGDTSMYQAAVPPLNAVERQVEVFDLLVWYATQVCKIPEIGRSLMDEGKETEQSVWDMFKSRRRQSAEKGAFNKKMSIRCEKMVDKLQSRAKDHRQGCRHEHNHLAENIRSRSARVKEIVKLMKSLAEEASGHIESIARSSEELERQKRDVQRFEEAAKRKAKETEETKKDYDALFQRWHEGVKHLDVFQKWFVRKAQINRVDDAHISIKIQQTVRRYLALHEQLVRDIEFLSDLLRSHIQKTRREIADLQNDSEKKFFDSHGGNKTKKNVGNKVEKFLEKASEMQAKENKLNSMSHGIQANKTHFMSLLKREYPHIERRHKSEQDEWVRSFFCPLTAMLKAEEREGDDNKLSSRQRH